MTIIWHGLSCFSIETKSGLGEIAALVIDPYDNATGLRFPRTLTADVVTVSRDHEHANNLAAISGKPFVITLPGEYEVRGVFVSAMAALRNDDKADRQLLFRIVSEHISIAHLGALDRPLTNDELAYFEDVDILMLPVGGGEVLDSKRAGELIGQIEPRIVIPMFYELPNLKIALAPVEKFLKEMGAGKIETLPKLKIAQKDLPQEDMQIKVLERS